MLETISAIDWAQMSQPEWNSPNEVPEALLALLVVKTESDAKHAYDRLLYALGNNHAGTYYPVVLPVIPFIGELLQHDNTLVRQTALEVLVDLTGSFEPERGFESIRCSGMDLPLRTALRDAVGELRPRLQACASLATNDSSECRLATALLDQIK